MLEMSQFRAMAGLYRSGDVAFVLLKLSKYRLLSVGLVLYKGKGKAHPCTGSEVLYRPTAHRRSRGIALLFHDHGTRCR
jgi:hypothetical protein